MPFFTALFTSVLRRFKNDEKNLLLFFQKTFGRLKNNVYLCIALANHGCLAQLVQSICLTSRGSGVRIPQHPPQEKGSHRDGLSLFAKA